MKKKRASDLLVMFLSVRSGHKTRELVREVVNSPECWETLRMPKPEDFSVVGMYELIGNWDLAVFMRAKTTVPGKLISHLRTQLLIQANHGSFPPVLESEGKFGRFAPVTVDWEQPSLDLKDHSPVQRTLLKGTQEYEKEGKTRTFIVIDASPNDERDAVDIKVVLDGMSRAVSEDPVQEIVECVYVGVGKAVVELMSTKPGATDVTRFNRLIDPGIAEAAVQKYTMLAYEYDEEPFGWDDNLAGTPDS
jgi:hypothetical protein